MRRIDQSRADEFEELPQFEDVGDEEVEAPQGGDRRRRREVWKARFLFGASLLGGLGRLLQRLADEGVGGGSDSLLRPIGETQHLQLCRN